MSHLTLTDDNASYAYLAGADVKLLVHSKYSAYDAMEPCTKCGASPEKNCANPPYGPDKARQAFLDCYCQTGFPMNRYMEKLHGQVDKGWIMYLDDDNLLLDPYAVALSNPHPHPRPHTHPRPHPRPRPHPCPRSRHASSDWRSSAR